MNELLLFLEKYEMWIYISLGVIIFFYLRRLLYAWQEWRAAIYGLEKETAQHKISSALSVIILLSIIAMSEFFLVSFVVPIYPRVSIVPTATLDLLATPTVTIAPEQMGTAVAPGDGVVEQITNEGCLPGEIEWIDPTAEGVVSGVVELVGTVNITNLGFYKYEFSQMGSENWITIAAGNDKKVDQPLGGVWNTTQLIPGDYYLRLIVTDSENQELPACIIPVKVEAAEEGNT